MLHQTPPLWGKPQPHCCFLMCREEEEQGACTVVATPAPQGHWLELRGIRLKQPLLDPHWVLLPSTAQRSHCVPGPGICTPAVLPPDIPGMPRLLASPCKRWHKAWLGPSERDQCCWWPCWAFREATVSIPPATGSQATSEWWLRCRVAERYKAGPYGCAGAQGRV